MLVSECQRNNSRNQAALRKRNIQADAAGVVAAAADALISRTVPLAEAPATFTALAAGDGTPGKVLVSLAT